jgi:hypothetical protein
MSAGPLPPAVRTVTLTITSANATAIVQGLQRRIAECEENCSINQMRNNGGNVLYWADKLNVASQALAMFSAAWEAAS